MSARGFTLIELIAVLVIVGLLLVFSPLGIQALIPERELEAEVSQLRTTIEMLRAQAMLDQAEYAIHYDTEKNKWAYQIPEEHTRENPNGSDEPVKALILDRAPNFEDLEWHFLPKGMSIDLYEGTRRIRGRFMVTLSPTGTVPPHSIVIEYSAIASLDDSP